jgi:DNA-binding response OmpR family regulator/two-component sensor histidine kinase
MLILGPIKEALSQHPDPEARKRLLLIQRQARRLLDLVSQLLDLARLEQTVVRLQASKRNIVPILKALVLSFTSLAERRKISLTFQTDLEDIQVYVEKDAFAKIVNNLVANAFKFTSEGDQIQVLVSVVEEPEISPAGVLQIDVVDTGLGIPRESQAHIFDRFFQSAQKHAPGKSSYGIGLALTKELVELHKGKILVESCEDLGSTFTVLLPLGNEHLSKDEMVGTRDDDEVPDLYLVEDEMADVEPIARSEGSLLPRILIVEDNQDVSNFIRSYLNKDFRCFEANNGSQALEMIHEQRFELIISDIMMPVMDGVELCQNIKSDQNTSHIPVILITAKADLSSKIEGLETGADDYLTKPFEAEELVQRAKNLIQQRQALRERFQREIALIPDDLELSSMDQKFIKNAMHLLSERMGDHNFSVNKFANEIHMSRQHLNRKLKAITGLSALEFIRSQRLKRAALLFRNEKATVTEIAFQVGFSNPSHFSRAFQGEFGLTPSKYLKRQRSLNSEA